MRSETEPRRAGRSIGGEVRHWIDPPLGRVHADADHPLDPACAVAPKLAELLDVVERNRRPELAVDVEDQTSRRAARLLRCGETLIDSGDDVGQRLPGQQVTGRGEERLAVNQPMLGTVDEALEGQSPPGPWRGQD